MYWNLGSLEIALQLHRCVATKNCGVEFHQSDMGSKWDVDVPSGYVKIAIEYGHKNVSFPMKNGDFP